MDVVLSTDRRRVAERFGDTLNALGNRLLRGFPAGIVADPGQLGEGQNGSAPGSKILGCQPVGSDLGKVSIDIAGVDCAALVVVVDVLKQPLPGQLMELLHLTGQSAVTDINLSHFSTFTLEFNLNPRG